MDPKVLYIQYFQIHLWPVYNSVLELNPGLLVRGVIYL